MRIRSLRILFAAGVLACSAIGVSAQNIYLPPLQVDQIVWVANGIQHMDDDGTLERAAQAFFVTKVYEANPNASPGLMLRILLRAQDRYDAQYKSFQGQRDTRFRMNTLDITTSMLSILANTPGVTVAPQLNTAALTFYLGGNFLDMGANNVLQPSNAIARARAGAGFDGYRATQMENLYRLARRNRNASVVVDTFFGPQFQASVRQTALQILDNNPKLRDSENFKPIVWQIRNTTDGSINTTTAVAKDTLRGFYDRLNAAFDDSMSTIHQMTALQTNDYTQAYLNQDVAAQILALQNQHNATVGPALEGATAFSLVEAGEFKQDQSFTDYEISVASMRAVASTARVGANLAVAIAGMDIGERVAAGINAGADGVEAVANVLDAMAAGGVFGQSAEDAALDGINHISDNLMLLNSNMNERFRIVDANIQSLYTQMNAQFATVTDKMNDILATNAQILTATSNAQNALLQVQSSVDYLTQSIFQFAVWQGRADLLMALNTIDNAIRNNQNLSGNYVSLWNTVDFFARTASLVNPSEVGPNHPNTDFDDINIERVLSTAPNPEFNINYLLQFANFRFANNFNGNDPTLRARLTPIQPLPIPIANPASWEMSVGGMLRLASYSPSLYLSTTVNDNANNGGGVFGAYTVGRNIQQAVADLTLEGYFKSPLFANLLTLHDYQMGKLIARLQVEEGAGTLTQTAVNSIIANLTTNGSLASNANLAVSGAQHLLTGFTTLGLSRSFGEDEVLRSLLKGRQRLPDGDMVLGLYQSWASGQPKPSAVLAQWQADRRAVLSNRLNMILDRLVADTNPVLDNRTGEPLASVDNMLRKMESYTRPFVTGRVRPLEGSFVPGQTVTLTFVAGSRRLIIPVQLDANGYFTVQLPATVYNLYVKADKFLQKRFNGALALGLGNIPSANNNTLIDIFLKPGDLNNDNKVDNTDVLLCRNSLNSSGPSANWNLFADLNSDGFVNATDGTIFDNANGTFPYSPAWNPKADFNGDNAVNAADLTAFRASAGARPGDANWNVRADINGSGAIDDGDLTVLKAALGSRGTSPGWNNGQYDFNADNVVTALDIRPMRQVLGATNASPNWNNIRKFDLDGNNVINQSDISIEQNKLGLTLRSPSWNAACDINQDGEVDGDDLSLFYGAYSTASSSPRYQAALDLNSDGVINGVDYDLLTKAMNTTPISKRWTPAADINGDGLVDSADQSLLQAALGSTVGSPTWNVLADLTGDNQVNMNDLNMLLRYFRQTGDTIPGFLRYDPRD